MKKNLKTHITGSPGTLHNWPGDQLVKKMKIAYYIYKTCIITIDFIEHYLISFFYLKNKNYENIFILRST